MLETSENRCVIFFAEKVKGMNAMRRTDNIGLVSSSAPSITIVYNKCVAWLGLVNTGSQDNYADEQMFRRKQIRPIASSFMSNEFGL